VRVYHPTSGDAALTIVHQGFQGGGVWLLSAPPPNPSGRVVLEVDLNVSPRDLVTYQLAGSGENREYLVPARWIARHATVHVSTGPAAGAASWRDDTAGLPARSTTAATPAA
jgi:hypothetical protein